jgi:hypothetical protein
LPYYFQPALLWSFVSVIGGSVCKETATFDFVSSFTVPFDGLFAIPYIAIPVIAFFALVIFPFAPKAWSRGGIITIIAVPIAIYVVLGGAAAYSLYQHPVTGCF